jgi:hypothetical protein
MVDETNRYKLNLGTVKGDDGNIYVPTFDGTTLNFIKKHNPPEETIQGMDLKGQQGNQGIQGNPPAIHGTLDSPSKLPTSNNKDGDIYLVNDGVTQGIVYQWYENAWHNVGNIVGPQGEQGPMGTSYALDNLFTLSVDDNGDLYVIYPTDSKLTDKNFSFTKDGDLYFILDPENGDSATKLFLGNAKGPKGDTGISIKADNFYYFTMDSDGNLYVVDDNANDFGYDPATGNLYKNYTGTNPILIGNVRGPKGDTGNSLIHAAIVTELPDPNSADISTLYFIKNSASSGTDQYDEYILVDNNGTKTFEQLGTKQIDLSNYFTKTEINTMLGSYLLKTDNISDSKILVTTENYGAGLTQNQFNAFVSSDILTVKSTLTNKANSSDVYTKTQVDAMSSGKADKTDVYSKAEIDALLGTANDIITG